MLLVINAAVDIAFIIFAVMEKGVISVAGDNTLTMHLSLFWTPNETKPLSNASPDKDHSTEYLPVISM